MRQAQHTEICGGDKRWSLIGRAPTHTHAQERADASHILNSDVSVFGGHVWRTCLADMFAILSSPNFGGGGGGGGNRWLPLQSQWCTDYCRCSRGLVCGACVEAETNMPWLSTYTCGVIRPFSLLSPLSSSWPNACTAQNSRGVVKSALAP